MCEFSRQNIPVVEADVCVGPERNWERANSEGPLLGGSAPAVR